VRVSVVEDEESVEIDCFCGRSNVNGPIRLTPLWLLEHGNVRMNKTRRFT
jgi:hypothetical protein